MSFTSRLEADADLHRFVLFNFWLWHDGALSWRRLVALLRMLMPAEMMELLGPGRAD